MGIFNFTIAGPQIIAGVFGSTLLTWVNGKPIYMIAIAGISMLLAALSVYFVKEESFKNEP